MVHFSTCIEENKRGEDAKTATSSTRRNVLRAVGASGAGVLAIKHGFRGVRADSDDVEIVTHKSRNKVARTEQVSKKWYNRKNRAKEALNRLR